MDFYHLQSFTTKKRVDEKASYTQDENGNPLDIVYDYDYIKARLNFYDLRHTPISHLKYMDFFPIRDRSKIITKGEGATPLYRLEALGKELGLSRLYIKNEGMNPTGVFKDRGTCVEITKAREIGAKAVCVASTGNMAASVSAYAAQAGLPCYVLVPEGTPVGKLAQTLVYGARVLQIRGHYDDCVRLAREMAEKYGYHLCGDYAFRREGQKSAAYEIIEQLGWQSPDVLICPVGFGTNLAGIYKGFVEFQKLGFIDRLPVIVGVQASGCSPIADAYQRGKRVCVPVERPDTIAGAVAVGNPGDAPFLFEAFSKTRGFAMKCDDDEILEAQAILGRKESIFVEPSSALPLAGVFQMMKDKEKRRFLISKSGSDSPKIVLIATGNGLKDPRAVLKKYATPPSADPNMSEIDRFLRFKLYKLGTSPKIRERERIVVETGDDMNLKRADELIRREFGLTLPRTYLEDVRKLAQIFKQKGKPISRIDFQRIIEDTLKERAKRKVLEFKDFKVETSLNARPSARVSVRQGLRTYEGCSEGVGPFDAIINAFKKAIPSMHSPSFELTDYIVEIDSAKTDATVKATITMRDELGNKVIGTGTSPDIIVASVLAYEEGYNLLLNSHENS